MLFADSKEQYGRRDNIRISGVEKNNDEDAYERVVEATNEIGLTISKKNSVCHRLPSRNPESRPRIAKFARRETKFRVMTQEKNIRPGH